MPDRPAALLSRLMIAATLSLPYMVQADAPRLYRVELIVFSDNSGTTAEQWEATPDLEYPGTARFLVNPARVKNNARQHGGFSRVDELGRQRLSNSAPTNNVPRATLYSRTGRNTVTQEASTNSPGEAVASTENTGARPTSFTFLPRNQLVFRSKAASMQKTGRYNILFHEAWTQTIASRSRALPIVLDQSGDDLQWPLLQGTIKLYKSRYLHLETNLWMNTDGEYLHSTWSMPPPPLGPPSVIVEEQFQYEPTAAPTVQVYDLHTQEEPLDLEEALAEELGPVYPFRHAVLLQQSRRMRSGEVHYIDHPMLGVIVKVTPLGK